MRTATSFNGEGRWEIPSNSLASVYGLISEKCARQHVLGEETQVEIEAYDECNWRINVEKLTPTQEKYAPPGRVLWAGSACSPTSFRARSIRREFRGRRAGVMGGFHVSGCLAMLPKIPPEMQQAMDLGITFCRRSEGRMADVLRDVANGKQSRFTITSTTCPTCRGAAAHSAEQSGQPGAGGIFEFRCRSRVSVSQCSFCTIINVQGRNSRYRSADDVEAIVRSNGTQGDPFFVTDDNFARNRNWEAISTG